MELNNVDGFISAFAILNLAYTGSKKFRSVLDDDILKITNPPVSKIKALEEEIEALKTLDQFGALGLNHFFEMINSNFKNRVDTESAIKERALKGMNIVECFKSIFLITSIFCFMLLIMAGYQELMGDELLSHFLFFLNLIFLYNLLIFIISVSNHRHKKIRPFIPVTIIISLLILFPVYVIHGLSPTISKFSSLEINVGFSLFVTTSAYFFYFVRLFILRMNYMPQLKKNDTECIKEVTKIKDVMLQYMGIRNKFKN